MTTSPPSRPITSKRRLAYTAIIYFIFLALLAAIEIGTRLTLPHLSGRCEDVGQLIWQR